MSLPDSDNEVTARRLSAVLTGLFSKISTALNLKADKVDNATNGHFAALDANGNLTDSGKNTADFATAAQGANADSAIQGVKVNGTDLSKDGNNVVDVPVPTASTATPLKDGTASAGSSSQWARGDHVHPTDDSREAVSNKKQVVNDSSTTEYPSSKAVADFVNSSVATNTANFLGTISESSLGLDYTATNALIALALNVHSWERTPTNNDYCFVSVNDPQTTDVDEYRRFKFNGSVWAYEYTLNNSSFTQPQWDAINSGLTSSDRTAYNAAVTLLNSHVGDGSIHVTSSEKNAWNGKQDTVSTDTDSSAFGDNTTIATGFSSDKLHLNVASRLWTYIQNKISSVLGLTASSYGGNAATATSATTATNYTSGGSIDNALAGKSNTCHNHDERYVRFDTNNQGLNDTQKSNARTNIGAGTSSLTLGTSTYDAARGNHAHGLLDRDGYFGSQNWAVSDLDRLAIAKNIWNGKEGYLVPSALHFDSDEGGKALTQSAEWKPFLSPTGDGSNVSVAPDGTSTGTDIGNSTTLNVWAQKFKNLVSSLKALAFKDKVSDSDISGTISDSHISSASTWNGKQNALGISSLGDANKYINQKGQWETPSNTWKLNDFSNEGYVKKGEGHYDCVWGTNSNGAPDWQELANLSVGYANSAGSASYATRASNYAAGGSISIRFASIESDINTLNNNLSTYSALGFRHWVFSSLGTFTPSASGKKVDSMSAGTATTKRRVGMETLFIGNNTGSDMWCELRVVRKHAVTGETVTVTFITKLFSYCYVPITIPMDAAHFSYEFWIYKNSSLATGSVTVLQDSWVLTSVYENSDE